MEHSRRVRYVSTHPLRERNLNYRLSPFATSVRNEETEYCRLLLPYPEKVNYLSKKYARDQAIAVNDATILCLLHPFDMTTQLYADDTISESCKIANVYGEGTLNDVFIEDVDAFISHSLHNYRATNSHTIKTDIAFQAELLLSIQKTSEKNPRSNYPSTNSAKLYTGKPRNNHNVSLIVNTKTTSNISKKTRRRSLFLQTLKINDFNMQSSEQGSAQRSSSSIPSLNPSFSEVCCDTFHLTAKCPFLTQDFYSHSKTICFRSMHHSTRDQRHKPPRRFYTLQEPVSVISDGRDHDLKTRTLMYPTHR